LATRRRASRSSITGTITDLQRRVKYLQTLPSPTRLANQVVRRVNIQPRAVDSDQLALRAVVNDSIEDDAIKLRNMDIDSVDTPQILDNAITRLKILDGEIVTSKVGDLQITNGKLGNGSVNAIKLANASVEENKIASGAVTNSKIGNSAVRTNNIQASAVTTSTIANANVTSDKLATSSVTNAKLGGGSVTSAKLASNSVTTDKIANSAVTNLKIASSAVTRSKIFPGSVNGTIIANGAVSNEKITNATITEEKLSSALRRNLIGGTGTGLDFFITNGKIIPFVEFGDGSAEVARGNHTHTTTLIGTQTSTPNSTERVKKNIEEYAPNNIKNLLNLNPKKYQYKRSMRQVHQNLNKDWMHGYLVEELITLGFPEPVGYDSEGLPASLDYGLMSMLVLELVKAQQTEIDSLREEVSRLKDKK
jgi:hypothetical protein